jgi:hypothetical protein
MNFLNKKRGIIMGNEETKKKDFWDKFSTFSQMISWLAIPVIIAIIGGNINSSLKDKELKQKYIEIAVGILQSDPVSGDDNIRDWAAKVISRYSEIPFDQNTIKSLKKRSLPRFYIDNKGSFRLENEQFAPRR